VFIIDVIINRLIIYYKSMVLLRYCVFIGPLGPRIILTPVIRERLYTLYSAIYILYIWYKITYIGYVKWKLLLFCTYYLHFMKPHNHFFYIFKRYTTYTILHIQIIINYK